MHDRIPYQLHEDWRTLQFLPPGLKSSVLSVLYCDLFTFNIRLSTILLSLFSTSSFSKFYTKDQRTCHTTLPTSYLPHTNLSSFLLYFNFIDFSLLPLCYWLAADFPQLIIFNQHPPHPFSPFHEKDRHCKHADIIYSALVHLLTYLLHGAESFLRS